MIRRGVHSEAKPSSPSAPLQKNVKHYSLKIPDGIGVIETLSGQAKHALLGDQFLHKLQIVPEHRETAHVNLQDGKFHTTHDMYNYAKGITSRIKSGHMRKKNNYQKILF